MAQAGVVGAGVPTSAPVVVRSLVAEPRVVHHSWVDEWNTVTTTALSTKLWCAECRRLADLRDDCGHRQRFDLRVERREAYRAVRGLLEKSMVVMRSTLWVAFAAILAAGIVLLDDRVHDPINTILWSVNFLLVLPASMATKWKKLNAGAMGIARPALPAAIGRVGSIVNAGALRTPVTDEPCAAFRLDLCSRQSRGKPLMLTYAESAGFDITLADGELVRVPRGLIEIVPAPTASLSAAAAREFARSVDPSYDDDSPIRCDSAYLRALVEGQTVQLLSDVTVAPAAKHNRGYRDATVEYRPVGTPRILAG